MSTAILARAASTTTAPSSQFSDRLLSCISGLEFGCSSDNWDHSPNSGFYTVCCDGNIIDVSGFNSWANYTLLLPNLICCPHEKGDDAGPIEVLHCNTATATALSELLATSTEVAQPWTRGTETIQPECFWSQLGLEDMASTTNSAQTSSSVAQSVIVTATTTAAPSTSTSGDFEISTGYTSSSIPASSSGNTSSSSSTVTPETTTSPTTASPTNSAARPWMSSKLVTVSVLLLLSLAF